MPLRAVLFDLWETLIQDKPDRSQPRRAWRSQAVAGVLQRHGFDLDGGAISKALDSTGLTLTAMHDSGHDLDGPGRAELFLQQLDAQAETPAPRAAASELHEVIASMPLDLAPHLAPHAAETLSALRRQGLGTALVSNAGMTTAPNLRLLLGHYGIQDLFDVLIFSDELLVAKPDPRIFRAALDGLALEAAACAFVGDNPHNDVSGALAAGFYTVQIGVKVREGVTPHARIDSLDQLIPAIEKGFLT